MNRLLPFAVAATLLVAPPVVVLQALAQTGALESMEAELASAWEQAPLAIRNSVFAADVQSYGMYTERPGPTFVPGEPIVVYGEPVGYGYIDNGDGTYTFGLSLDFVVKSAAGDILGGKEGFETFELVSHRKNREFLLKLSVSLSGAEPGDYVLEYTAHDIASDETATVSMPFTIAE